MGALGSTAYRVVCGVVLCGIALSLFPEGRMKSMLHMACGLFLTVLLLTAISGVKLPEFEEFGGEFYEQAQAAAAAGEDYTRQQYRELIKQRLEAYILDIAHRKDCVLTVHVEVDGDGRPVSAVLQGNIPEEKRRELEEVIAEELGIAKEDQQWNGSQTRNQSAVP